MGLISLEARNSFSFSLGDPFFPRQKMVRTHLPLIKRGLTLKLKNLHQAPLLSLSFRLSESKKFQTL